MALVRRTTVLRLALLLPSARLLNLDRYGERFHSAAVSGATHRRRAEIVEADGDPSVRVGDADAVGRIEPNPAEFRHEGLPPGMAGLLIDDAVRAQEMSGDEARRHAGRTRAGNK